MKKSNEKVKSNSPASKTEKPKDPFNKKKTLEELKSNLKEIDDLSAAIEDGKRILERFKKKKTLEELKSNLKEIDDLSAAIEDGKMVLERFRAMRLFSETEEAGGMVLLETSTGRSIELSSGIVDLLEDALKKKLESFRLHRALDCMDLDLES